MARKSRKQSVSAVSDDLDELDLLGGAADSMPRHPHSLGTSHGQSDRSAAFLKALEIEAVPPLPREEKPVDEAEFMNFDRMLGD